MVYFNYKKRENDKYIIIDIIDEGVGIFPKDIKRVFEPFTGENGLWRINWYGIIYSKDGMW